MLLVEGIVSILAGVVAFAYPDIPALVFVYLLAAWAVVTGISEIVVAFSLPLGASCEWLLGLAEVASILFGVLIAFQPKSGRRRWNLAGSRKRNNLQKGGGRPSEPRKGA